LRSEKEMGAKVCVKMDGPTTILVDPESGQDKKFTFDFSYWSHDGFDTKEDGETVGVDEKYATQRMVFNDLGRDVLNSAFDGYNSCLFAYGQTGSGKSYSMVGYGKNKGIIPIVCEEMFNAIAANTDPTVKYQVVVSMLEIYNECVKDLLNPKVNPPGGLKIRSKPGIGVYVEDLTPVPVASYAAIEAQMEEGTLNRTVASTKMNATSSRAHTVFTIIFTKKHTDMGLTSETQSRMNLVDLAGSERAESTGATGDRLKEGCAINASLSALGNVISALADLSSGKAKKGAFVPYRNSALTRLLQDALGGNSRTIMICALSPADVNFDETLSTLRYADRAKQIKNKVFKMENPTDALIAKLKAENARLMAMLEGKIPLAGNGDGDGGDSGNKEEVTSLQQRLKEIEEEKAANERLLKDMQKSWEDRLREAEAAREEAAAAAAKSGGGAVSLRTAQASTRPFMVNLHEDPQMTEKVVYVFNDGDTRVGRADADIKQDIVLSGLNIRAEHAVIHYNAETGGTFHSLLCCLYPALLLRTRSFPSFAPLVSPCLSLQRCLWASSSPGRSSSSMASPPRRPVHSAHSRMATGLYWATTSYSASWCRPPKTARRRLCSSTRHSPAPARGPLLWPSSRPHRASAGAAAAAAVARRRPTRTTPRLSSCGSSWRS
jgi:hypothetical protein